MQQVIVVVGAGIIGLWQSLSLARRGHRVHLVEASDEPFADSASRLAGTMLAPECEFLHVHDIARTFARHGLKIWQDTVPAVVTRGTLVVAAARDRAELHDFAAQTENFARLDGDGVADLEPVLKDRFSNGLYYKGEAHMATDQALDAMLKAVRRAGVEMRFGAVWDAATAGQTKHDIVIDCRGLAARDVLPDLRGVRGERLLIKADGVELTRPVRLLHPRHSLYIVPWGSGRYVIGATELESEDRSGVSVRSALDLLATAYSVHPAFGEAEILNLGSGVRPALPDNLPRIIVRQDGRHILVNGAHRHGFLLAPVLGEATADFLETAAGHPWLIGEDETCPAVKAR